MTTIKILPKEYIFHHRTGEFTGFITHTIGNLMAVKLTSPARSILDRKNHALYQPGEIRYINVKCEKTEK